MVDTQKVHDHFRNGVVQATEVHLEFFVAQLVVRRLALKHELSHPRLALHDETELPEAFALVLQRRLKSHVIWALPVRCHIFLEDERDFLLRQF